jgi:hypothetical protein
MKWFGPPWGAPVNTVDAEVAVPEGANCAHCGGPIGRGAQGFMIWHHIGLNMGAYRPWHLDCLVHATNPHAAGTS